LGLFLIMDRASLTSTVATGTVISADPDARTAPMIERTAGASAEEAAATAGWRLAAIVVLVFAAILFFARLGARALWSSEFRWAEIAREMLLTHNYFWPTINGMVYYDKPLGSYWLVVAATQLTGAMTEEAARIPCAVAGLLGVALLILLARRLYDLRTGVIAGLVLATSFSFVFFSRHASADVETVTGELAVLALYLYREDRPPGTWVIGLWLIMAVTSLTKGLLGFALPLLIIGAYTCLATGWTELGGRILHGPIAARWRWLVERNRWFFNRWTIVAIAIGGAIYYAPFAVSDLRTGSAKGLHMVYRENLQRYFEPFDHRGPVYLYTYVIFALMAPWSMFIPAALVQAHHRRHAHAHHARSDRFALVFFWATFIFFTLSGSRRSYYLLPILPAAAILVSRLLVQPPDEIADAGRRLLKLGYGLIVAAVAASTLAFVPPHSILPQPWSQLPMAPCQPSLALYWIVSIAAVVWTTRHFSSARITLSTGVIAYLFMMYFFVFAMPASDAWRGEKPFAYEVRRIIGNDTGSLACFKNEGPIYYLGLPKPIPYYARLSDLNAAIRSGHVRWVIVRRRDTGQLAVPARIAVSEAIYPWDRGDHRLNAMVLMRVEQPPS
jgi:4-amino-4-deoxy-L-arabinose transferase-like glycosyltransferase